MANLHMFVGMRRAKYFFRHTTKNCLRKYDHSTNSFVRRLFLGDIKSHLNLKGYSDIAHHVKHQRKGRLKAILTVSSQ